MTQTRPRGMRTILLSGLGLLFMLLGAASLILGLLYGAFVLLVAQFFPGGRWDGLTEEIVYWVISLITLFGLSRLSYAWATDPKPVPTAASSKAGQPDAS